MSESPTEIPERCKDCPFIVPAFDAYTRVEAELYMLENSQQLSEYAGEEDVEVFRSQAEQFADQLRGLRALTVGCAGIKLAQVEFDEEYVSDIQCQSPLAGML